MLYAVEYKNGIVGVLDTDDNSTEYCSLKQLRHYVVDLGLSIEGVTVEDNVNPIYTLEGMTINLFYHKRSMFLGRYTLAILLPGEYWGRTFSTEIKKPTVAFFDMKSGFDKHKYPNGQYIASYNADTLLGHKGGLILGTSVEDWRVSPSEMKNLQQFISATLGLPMADIYTLEGYNFEGKIKVNGDTLTCCGVSCSRERFERSLRDDYQLMLEEREIDREADFHEYLSTLITGDWILHNVKLCSKGF